MIKKIIVKNFQAHDHVELELDEGVNVIAGSSDTGKSSILRAIDLVRENRPSGFSYRHDPRITKKSKKQLADSAITSSTIILDNDVSITRERNKKDVNQYKVNDEIFKALRSDVPEDVSTLLNIASYSVQSQHNPYFLLNESDGEVSRQINDLVGLEAIDKVYKKINAIVSEAKLKSENTARDIENTERDIEALKNISKIQSVIDSIDERIVFYADAADKLSDLDEIISDLTVLQDQLNDEEEFLKHEQAIESLYQKAINSESILTLSETLSEEIAALEHSQEKVANLANLTALETRVNELCDKALQLELTNRDIKNIIASIDLISEKQNKIYDIQAKIETTSQEYIAALKQAKVCPTCGGAVNEKLLKDIL
jgi:exonuclease SbcC